MRKVPFIFWLILVISAGFANAQSVKLKLSESEKRVDVEIDGKLFTSYRWDERIKRPVLYPLMTVGGAFVTRGFPFETRDGETVDHPHQVGVSFSYGDVNGIDFWNTSTFRSAKEFERMGTIVHEKVLSIKSGNGRGELVTKALWLSPAGKPMLEETTKYVFNAKGKLRSIDRETKLTAVGTDAVFGDSKEGLYAIHVASELEQADQVGVKVTGRDGTISKRESADILSGKYASSEGLTGNNVWGTFGKWASVSGRFGEENVTVAMFDHQKNHNFPSRMMVRGYGLLALNPFGQKLFDAKMEERKFTLPAGRSMTFRHRLLIMPETANVETIEKQYQSFK